MSVSSRKENDSVFVVERPLQIMNAIELVRQLDLSNNVDFFVANTFRGAEGVSDRISRHFPDIDTLLFGDYKSAITSVSKGRYKNLFLHWDVGFGTDKILYNIKRLNPDLLISVFEEGIGTYRSDIYSPIKRKIFRMINLPINVGGSRHTDRIFVHNIDEYRSAAVSYPNAIIKINNSISDSIKYNWDRYLSVFDNDGFINSIERERDIICNIYMSAWEYNEDIANLYFRDTDINIIKLHPYCKSSALSSRAVVAPAGIPAEILIFATSDKYGTVNVIHHGSSSPRYIDAPNVKFFKVPQV